MVKVVNDTAQRIIALIQSYNSVLAKHENEKQLFLQVVENRRRRFSIQTNQLNLVTYFNRFINVNY